MKVLTAKSRKTLLATVTATAFIATVNAQAQGACESACQSVGSLAAQQAFSSVIQNIPSCYRLPTDLAISSCVNSITAVANSAAMSAQFSATQGCLASC